MKIVRIKSYKNNYEKFFWICGEMIFARFSSSKNESGAKISKTPPVPLPGGKNNSGSAALLLEMRDFLQESDSVDDDMFSFQSYCIVFLKLLEQPHHGSRGRADHVRQILARQR